MAPFEPHADLSAYPPELIESVADSAGRDAELAAQFLSRVGLTAAAGDPISLPPAFLLNVGAAMRLLRWELAGHHTHTETSLPAAKDALVRVFREAADAARGGPPAELWLSQAVFKLSRDCFAWSGRLELNAEITVGTPDEDALIEAMAQFLWRNRHAGTTHPEAAT